jgi:hypothetical protein
VDALYPLRDNIPQRTRHGWRINRTRQMSATATIFVPLDQPPDPDTAVCNALRALRAAAHRRTIGDGATSFASHSPVSSAVPRRPHHLQARAGSDPAGVSLHIRRPWCAFLAVVLPEMRSVRVSRRRDTRAGSYFWYSERRHRAPFLWSLSQSRLLFRVFRVPMQPNVRAWVFAMTLRPSRNTLRSRQGGHHAATD